MRSSTSAAILAAVIGIACTPAFAADAQPPDNLINGSFDAVDAARQVAIIHMMDCPVLTADCEKLFNNELLSIKLTPAAELYDPSTVFFYYEGKIDIAFDGSKTGYGSLLNTLAPEEPRPIFFPDDGKIVQVGYP